MSEGEGVRSGISLIVEVLKNKGGEGEKGESSSDKKEPEKEDDTGKNDWVKAFENLQKRIEAGENEQEPEEEIGQNEIDALAERLMEYGVAEDAARENAAKYPKQLMQVESMGYVDKMNEAIALLDGNNGNINTTIETLLQGTLDNTTELEGEEEVVVEGEDEEEDDDKKEA